MTARNARRFARGTVAALIYQLRTIGAQSSAVDGCADCVRLRDAYETIAASFERQR